MILLEAIEYFKEITGRFDLTEVQIIRYLNQGQLYLDSMYSRETSLTEYAVTLPCFTRTFRIPNCISIEKLGYSFSYEGDFRAIEKRVPTRKKIMKETGYGHFYGVSYSGNTISMGTFEGIKQDFLLSNFRVGQKLSVYMLGAGGQLELTDLPVSTDEIPTITFVERNQLMCDKVIPDGGTQIALIGYYSEDETLDSLPLTYHEQSTAKRFNFFNVKSIIPTVFDGVIELSKPLQQNTLITAQYQAVEPLLEHEDVSWWSLNHPEILVTAAAYMLERYYRNASAMNDWQVALMQDLTSLYNLDAKKRDIKTNQMDIGFNLF